MSKKLITACLALFALAAFALPAGASAANTPVVTHPTGTKLATGTKIAAHNINGNTKFLNDAGTAVLTECTTAVMKGELTKNNGTEVEGNLNTATFSGSGAAFNGMNECTSTFGNLTVTTNSNTDGETVENGTPWCIRSTGAMAEDEIQLRGGKCAEAAKKLTFKFDVTGTPPVANFECKYERAATEPLKATYTTDTPAPTIQDAVVHLKPGANTTFKGEAGNNVLCPTQGTLEMSITLETDAVATEPLFFS